MENKNIFALCDYKGIFGSKYYARPYRSGMDKDILAKEFSNYGYKIKYIPFIDINNLEIPEGQIVIYTSSEDPGYKYKEFIEDIVYYLEICGVNVIPSFKYLRANNNKVFMELLRKLLSSSEYQILTKVFGCYEELIENCSDIPFPCVVKEAKGAGSKGVHIAKNKNELEKVTKAISRTTYFAEDIRDVLRTIKHKGYIKESLHRSKFIVQEFIPNLSNDWKVLVYWDKYYVLRRKNRPNDFRASGSGLFSFDEIVDPRLLDAAREIRQNFDVPMISLDLAISNNRVVLIEFQFVYFGTSTLEESPYYYVDNNGHWEKVLERSNLEDIYSYSIVSYIEDKIK